MYFYSLMLFYAFYVRNRHTLNGNRESIDCCGVHYKNIIHIIKLQLLCTIVTVSRLTRLL